MGHDIELVGTPVEFYFSFNWGIFPQFRRIFDIHEIHGHNNERGLISRRLEQALAKLARMGYVPRNDLGVDQWGNWIDNAKVDFVAGKTRVLFKQVRKYKGREYWTGILDCLNNNAWFRLTDEEGKIISEVPRFIADDYEVDSFHSRDCYCMFMYILREFLKMAEKYPHATWKSDQIDEVMPLYGFLPGRMSYLDALKQKKTQTKI